MSRVVSPFLVFLLLPSSAGAKGPAPFNLATIPGTRSVTRPARIACEIATDRYLDPPGALQTFTLAAVPGGPRFVTVSGGAVRVLVPTGAASLPFMVEAESGGLFVRGHLVPATGKRPAVDAGSLRVRPARAFALGGFYWPAQRSVLRLVRDARRGFAVTPVEPLPAAVEVPRGVLPADVPCDALALEQATTAFAPVLPAGKPRQARLRSTAVLPLLDRPRGKLLVTLRAAKGLLRIDVHPARDEHVQVAWVLESGVITGWVDARVLTASEVPEDNAVDLASLGPGGLVGYGRGGGRAPDPRLVCQDDAPLIAELPAPKGSRAMPVRFVVGGFRRGTRIPITGSDADTTGLYLPSLPGGFWFDKGVRMVLPKVALGACQRG